MANQDFTLLVGTKIDDTQILQQLNTISKKTSVTVKVNADTGSLETLKTVTTKSTDAMGNLVTTTEKFNKSGQSLGTVISGVTEKAEKQAKAYKDVATSADKASKSTSQLQGFMERTKKVFDFGLSTASLGLLYSAINEAKEAIVDFDAAMTEFNKVSSINDEQLNSYIDTLSVLGEEVGRTRTEMLQATTEFIKTGASEEDAMQLAQLATLYQNIADSQINAGDSASYITSQMKAFNITANDAVSILDKTNEVSNRFAVSSSDISSALTTTSGAMATYGNTIDETIALTVAGTEILTGQAGKVSRGLRSVGAEIVKLANETGEFTYQVDGATKTLSLFDEQGKMLSTFDALSLIYEDWNKMNEAEQSNLALTLGMKTQIDVLGATLNNFDSALNAVTVSQQSQGSAMRENEAYMESLQAKTNLLTTEFQELVLGEGGLTALAKGFLDFSTGILKLINGLGGLQTIIVLLSGILLTKFAPAIEKTIKNIPNLIVDLVNKFTVAEVSTNSLSKGFTTLGISASTAQVAIGTLTAIITIAVMAWNSYKQAQEEADRARQEATQKAQQEIESLESLKEQINNESLSREELSNLIKNSSISAYDEEISKLQDVNEARQAAIDKIEEEQKKRAEELVSTGLTDYEKALKEESEAQYPRRQNLYGFWDASGSSEYKAELNSALKKANINMEDYFGFADFDTQIEKLKEYKDVLIDLRGQEEESSALYHRYSTEIEHVETAISNLTTKHEENQAVIDKFNDSLGILGKTYDAETKTIRDMTEEEQKNYEFKKKQEDELKQLEAEADAASKSIEELGNASYSSFAKMNKATEEQQNAIKDLASEIDEITSAYETAVNAMDEYNQQGYLSVDTYSQLMQVAPEYLALMIDENGQLKANADAVTYLYQARVLEMGVKAAEAQINLASSLSSEAGAYAELGTAAFNAADGVWALVDAKFAELQVDAQKKGLATQDYNTLTKNIDAIKNLTSSTIQNAKYIDLSTNSKNKNTSATQRQTDALNKQKQVLQEQSDIIQKELDDYEIVIDYVKDLLEEEQEALEKQKDAELEAIQDKIDALEKEQEAMEENVDSQIEALEKQRDEQEKYWDDQINAIKDANDELEENIKLQELQEALARAKTQKVKVLKDGEFVYALDEEAISQAQQDLADYEMELAVEKQIEELEKLKEEALNSIDNQIDQLEEYRKQQNENYQKQLEDLQNHYNKVEEEYDRRIEQYDQWLEQFNDMLEASSKRHAEILYNELVGEKGTWDERIKALGSFVSNYEKKKNQLDGIKTEIENIDKKIKQIEDSANNSYGNVQKFLEETGLIIDEATQDISFGGGGGGGSGGKSNTIQRYASGSYSVPDDQIALVADPVNPKNREIVIGSKINKGDGVITKLKKGSGVIPSKENLTENVIKLAKWAGNNVQNAFSTKNESKSNIVNIENINLPEVKDGNSFVEYLRDNFMNDSIQYANVRG